MHRNTERRHVGTLCFEYLRITSFLTVKPSFLLCRVCLLVWIVIRYYLIVSSPIFSLAHYHVTSLLNVILGLNLP